LNPILATCMSRGNEARIWSGHHLQNDLCLARLRSAPRLCTLTSPRRSAYVPEPLGHLPWRGDRTVPRFRTAPGYHLHERGRGWPPFSFRGADDLQPIFMTCMSRGNEARIWSGHHLQNDLCLARLRSAPRPCTLTSPRRWAYVPEPLGHLPWRGYRTAPRFRTAWLTPSRERSRRSPYQ